jgi:hypothetical protein
MSVIVECFRTTYKDHGMGYPCWLQDYKPMYTRTFESAEAASAWLQKKEAAINARGGKATYYAHLISLHIKKDPASTLPPDTGWTLEIEFDHRPADDWKPADPEPIEWSKLDKDARVVCWKCAGTGLFKFRDGRTDKCFRCDGKGEQTQRDDNRNIAYDELYAR